MCTCRNCSTDSDWKPRHVAAPRPDGTSGRLAADHPRDQPPPDPYAIPHLPNPPIVRDGNGVPDPYATALRNQKVTDRTRQKLTELVREHQEGLSE